MFLNSVENLFRNCPRFVESRKKEVVAAFASDDPEVGVLVEVF